ncbi:MAG: hypothetical protein M0Z85_05015 [Gammaproteobacteria bacterium]|nr:hypothetical protein [Gammaproteobacteria bacterium]
MTDWTRDTPWRQGLWLSADSTQALGFLPLEPAGELAVVVISHDCDLAQSPEGEPVVEVIVGRVVAEANGTYTNTKNLRRLHLPCTAGTRQVTVELDATGKRLVDKLASDATSGLAGHVPEPSVRLKPEELRILQMWLAARYRRAAFPDEFDRRLKDETKLAERLGKLLRSTGSHISALFFEVDGHREMPHSGADDPYELHIVVVYSTQHDPAAAQQAAEGSAAQIKGEFAKQCKVTGQWRWIELVDVEVLSDEAITYAMSQRLLKWQADHISLRADPMQPIFED